MDRLESRVHLKRSGITGGLVVLGLVAGLIGLLADGRPQMAVGAAVLTAVVVDALAAHFTVASVQLGLHGPPEAVAGEPSEWVLHPRGIRRPVVVSPAVVPRSPRSLVRADLPALVTLPPAPRGLVHHVVLDVTATGPIGLYQAGRRVVVPLATPLAVGPARWPVPVEWPRPRAVGFGLTQGAPLGDDLFRSIRPYTRGDERRRIHWRSTAHHGRLMVREHDGTGVVAVRVLVEPGTTGPQGDYATGMAATIADQALARGWLVQLVTADRGHAGPASPAPTNPFKAPHPVVVPAGPVATTTRAERVTSTRAVSHQLATAAQGPLLAPPWPGLTCHVSPAGVRWS